MCFVFCTISYNVLPFYCSCIPAEHLPKDSTSISSGAIRQQLNDECTPRVGSSQQVSSSLQLPVKREREPSTESEPSTQVSKKLLTVSDPTVNKDEESLSSPMDQDTCSIEIVEPESDDSVIDLTQDT